MKRSLLLIFMLPLLHIGAGAQPNMAKSVEANCSVVKSSPVDAYDITVNVHLRNLTKEQQDGHATLSIISPDGKVLKDTTFAASLAASAKAVLPMSVKLPDYGNYTIEYKYAGADGSQSSGKNTWLTEPVNFFYAFTQPHRLAVAMPDASGKTLMDVSDGMLTMWWTYQDLDFLPYDSFREIKADWRIVMQPQIDGKPFATSSWRRKGGFLPIMENIYEADGVTVVLEAVGTRTAGLVKVITTNNGTTAHHVRLPWICPGNFKGYNPGWIDEDLPTDHLLAGWNAPADKVLLMGYGADSYPTDPVMTTQMNMDWTVQPGQTATGYLVRPYNSFARDLESLRTVNWEAEFNASVKVWEDLAGRASDVIIPDTRVTDAYLAGLMDIFIMREPIGGGYIGTVPGTNGYRSGPNDGESAIATVALSQAGMYDKAEEGYRVNWDLQEEDGDWTERGGWSHLCWSTAGYKAWAAMEYYENSRDSAFMEKRFPQMLAMSRWQHSMRQRSRKLNADGSKPLTWGLMPKGMGDCGLRNGDSYYGIYTSHNILSVFADSLSYRAALILGRTEEAAELKAIYDEARTDLLRSMREGSFTDDEGRRYLTAMPGDPSEGSSDWGLLFPVSMTGLLPADDELMTGTLARSESILSPGGMPVHTGWMADGMWVAITVNDFAQVHLRRDEPDQAAAYLYSTLNHASPFYSWCEERGQFPGAKQISGDIQHLWTPVAVSRFIRDMLVMEEGSTLHLARGIAREWLLNGQAVGIHNASTRLGKISYSMRYHADKKRLTGEIICPDRLDASQMVIHAVLPDGKRLASTSVGKIAKDGRSIIITPKPGATIHFEATVRK